MLMVARTGIMNIPFGHVLSYRGHAFLSMLKCLDHVIGGSVIDIICRSALVCGFVGFACFPPLH